jgi:hypothetical protein
VPARRALARWVLTLPIVVCGAQPVVYLRQSFSDYIAEE